MPIRFQRYPHMMTKTKLSAQSDMIVMVAISMKPAVGAPLVDTLSIPSHLLSVYRSLHCSLAEVSSVHLMSMSPKAVGLRFSQWVTPAKKAFRQTMDERDLA